MFSTLLTVKKAILPNPSNRNPDSRMTGRTDSNATLRDVQKEKNAAIAEKIVPIAAIAVEIAAIAASLSDISHPLSECSFPASRHYGERKQPGQSRAVGK